MPVNSGKTLFAQLMDFLPWSTFTRIVSRYGGGWGGPRMGRARRSRASGFSPLVPPGGWRVRTFPGADRSPATWFAKCTYRGRLRDTGTCLSAQAAKLFAMGFGDP